MTTADGSIGASPPRGGLRGLPQLLLRRLGTLSPQVWTLLFVLVVYSEVMTFLSYLRYLGFLTNAWDLGIFQQALWTTGHGEGILHYTVEQPWNPGGNFLGVHFSPILFLLVPLYAVAPGALTLMALQSLVVAASAFPMYGLASRRMGAWPGCGLAVLYLVSPPIVGGLLFDFHVEAFLPLFALTFWYAWETRRFRLAIGAAVLLLMTLEYAPVLLGAIAASVFLERLVAEWRTRHTSDPARRWRSLAVPLAIVLSAVPLTLLLFHVPKWIEPATPPVGQVGPLGGSVSDILVNSVLHPHLLVTAVQVYGAHKVQYLQNLLFTGLFAWPLGVVEALPALPWIFIALVSTDPNYSLAVGNQYAFLVQPFLIVGTANALRLLYAHRTWLVGWLRPAAQRLAPRLRRFRLTRPRPRWLPMVALVAVVAVAVPGQALYSPFSPNTHYNWLWEGTFPTARDLEKAQVIDLIPAGASVSAEPDLFPQVADRPNAYPYFVAGTQFLVCDVTSWWFTTALPAPMPPMQWIDELRNNVTQPYGLLAAADGVLLYQLNYSGPILYFVPYQETVAPPSFSVVNATFSVGGGAPLGSFLNPNPARPIGPLWDGPSVIVPPGTLVLSLWVHPRPSSSGSVTFTASLAHDGTLGALTVASSSLPDAWTTVTETVTVPFAGYLNVSAMATGSPPAVQFGGLVVVQTNAPVRIG